MGIKRISYILLLCFTLTSCAVLSPQRQPSYYAGSAEEAAAGYAPKGTLKEMQYSTSVPGPLTRRMIVYLPEGYEESDKRYPVIYLLHGARGYETSWILKGDILRITDSLVTNGFAEPAIIVMPNVNQYNNDADMDLSRRKSALESLFEIDGTVETAFLNDVVAFTDNHFRTMPDKRHRAIGGLSIGGLQSLYISANAPDKFGYIGMFSPMHKIMQRHSAYNKFYKGLQDKLQTQFACAPYLYLIMIGKRDFFLPHIKNYHRYLNKQEYQHKFIITPGGHDWPYWKQDYIYFLKQAFK